MCYFYIPKNKKAVKATTIKEVISQLDLIIQQCKDTDNRLGYFAILYKKMTLAVERGIIQGVFEDGKRMEQLDVHFANRYLEAYDQYHRGAQPTDSWKTAFDAAQQQQLSILQHLLLGINAHINLDLGISAAAITTTQTLADLEGDFNKINDVIADVYNDLQSKLKQISWLVMFIKSMNSKSMDALINFSIGKARTTAWNHAILLSQAGDHRDKVMVQSDAAVTRVAGAILNPGILVGFLLKWIVKSEEKSIARNLQVLAS